MWNVQYTIPETGLMHYCEKPFQTKESAELYARTIEICTPFKVTAIFQEKANDRSECK